MPQGLSSAGMCRRQPTIARRDRKSQAQGSACMPSSLSAPGPGRCAPQEAVSTRAARLRRRRSKRFQLALRRAVPRQRFVQLLRINGHVLHTPVSKNAQGCGNALPNRREQRVQQLLFDVEGVRPGRLCLIKSVQTEWLYKGYRRAALSGCCHVTVSLSGGRRRSCRQRRRCFIAASSPAG